MEKTKNIDELKEIARKLRIECLKMLHTAGCGHTGGPLGMMDLMTVLYFSVMNHDPQNPHWPDRDRFILANGHTCPALYVCLAEAGYFPKTELAKLRKLGSPLQGHPKLNVDWGIEMSTGSLGQGMSIANGIAFAARLTNKNFTSYSFHSDGESQEGMLWEAALSAGHHRLDNRIGILDYNNIQIDGFNDQIKNVMPLKEKFEAFRWAVREIDGHNYEEILDAFDWAKAVTDQPAMIIARTILGKGVSLFENKPKYHGVAPNDEELQEALKELGA